MAPAARRDRPRRRAKRTTSATSPAVSQKAIARGDTSRRGFHSERAANQPWSSGVSSVPRRRPRSSAVVVAGLGAAGAAALSSAGAPAAANAAPLRRRNRRRV